MTKSELWQQHLDAQQTSGLSQIDCKRSLNKKFDSKQLHWY